MKSTGTATTTCSTATEDPTAGTSSLSQDVQPAELEPPATEPAELEPPATEPAALEPPATEPAELEPPATEPAELEPPATEPAELEHSVIEPAETEPIEFSSVGETTPGSIAEGSTSARLIAGGSTSHKPVDVEPAVSSPGIDELVGSANRCSNCSVLRNKLRMLQNKNLTLQGHLAKQKREHRKYRRPSNIESK